MSEDISPGELARRMNDVLRQFQSLVDQVETRYIRKDYIELYKANIDQTVAGMKAALELKADKTEVASLASGLATKVDKSEFDAAKADIAELKDTNKWLFRLVAGFIILAILGAVLTVGSGGFQ